MTVQPFRHDVAGTPASRWSDAIAARALPALELPASRDRLVVAGAHPDDETLGAGGLIRWAALAGWEVEVVSATLGEASHPGSPTHSPQRLADVRRGELRDAVAHLAPQARVTCLDLPDGDVGAHAAELVTRLVGAIGTDGARVVLCAPWHRDGHPDHEAVGRAAAVAAARTDALLLEYPVWLWHWGGEDDLPWADARRLGLDPAARDAKRSAVAAHASQVRPLSPGAGDEVLLDEALLAHFDRDEEVFLTRDGRVADDAFEQLHRERPDPWDVGSAYERRKRALTLASLPRAHYRTALEVGCSVGELAADLAARCDRLLAVDGSPAAIDLARERTSALPHVEVRLARVPDEWPTGRHDLVSISEVGYFLSPGGLDRVVDLTRDALADDGHLLLCHWRHPIVGWPLDGRAVHDAFLATGAPVLVEHREPDFLLHVLGRWS